MRARRETGRRDEGMEIRGQQLLTVRGLVSECERKEMTPGQHAERSVTSQLSKCSVSL